MHQYIQYLFLIFGSVSIMLGCDNNNNVKTLYQCSLCNPKKRNVNHTINGLCRDKQSFMSHFNVQHRKDFLEELYSLKRGEHMQYILTFAIIIQSEQAPSSQSKENDVRSNSHYQEKKYSPNKKSFKPATRAASPITEKTSLGIDGCQFFEEK